jgi:hypothetical protein
MATAAKFRIDVAIHDLLMNSTQRPGPRVFADRKHSLAYPGRDPSCVLVLRGQPSIFMLGRETYEK